MLENNLPKPKLAVLDGYTLNPGDLSWKALEDICDLQIYDKTLPSDVLERAKDCDAIFTNKVAITSEIVSQLPKLKYVGVMATGFNIVDLEATKKAGIVVTNIPSYSTKSVAQLVFAFIFDFMWHVNEHSVEVQNGKWTKSEHFCYHSFPVRELCDKTLGVVGFGNIGQEVAHIGLALGMNVIYSNRSQKTVPELKNAKQVSVDELFSQADFISLNCPLTDETKHLLNAERLEKVKPTAYIINTARGPLADENAVANALKKNKFAGYAADVLSIEPPPSDDPLLTAPNCLLTPHIAWQTLEARTRLMDILIDNYKSFLDGKIKNRVN